MSHHTKAERAQANKLLTKSGYKPMASKDTKKPETKKTPKKR